MNSEVVNLNRMVSVIMPAKDTGHFIASAIESVIAQDYPFWELLVVDDHSRDDTPAVVKRFTALDSRIVYFSLSGSGRTGVAAARNLAARMSRGRYIAFLDSDDLWHPNKLSLQLRALASQKAALCYSGYRKMSEQGVVKSRVARVPVNTTYRELLKSNVIACSTVIYDSIAAGTTFLPEVTAEGRHYFEDYAAWLQIARNLRNQEMALVGVEEALAVYRLRKGSISYRKWKAALYTWRVYRRIERLPLYSSIYYFCYYAIRGLKKHLL